MSQREAATGISVETARMADDLAVAVLSLVDVGATGRASVHDLMVDAITKADEYRRSRIADATARLAELELGA